ncbi:DNA-binding protein [Candidatus Pacearchaeota archaeon]|nr:DNA-binding protein [Candidatus Pacearchaeota archaeon]
MKITELIVGQGNVEVEGKISNIGNTRSFNKYGKQLTVANAVLTDDSGSITLTLWNEDVKRFKEGDTIKIINGYVNEFQGEKQLTAGKYGSMEKIGSGNSQEEIMDEQDKIGETDEQY